MVIGRCLGRWIHMGRSRLNLEVTGLIWRAMVVGSDICGQGSIGFKRNDDRSIRMDALDWILAHRWWLDLVRWISILGSA